MNAAASTPPSSEQVLSLVHGELSSARRWRYRLILLAASVVTAAILSLWATEPGPLPLRLHVAFAVMTTIGSGWIAVLTWILMRHRCPTALDRVATGWMATIACLLFMAVAVPIALQRGQPGVALSLCVLGLTLVCIALYLLAGAYSLRARLRAKLAELKKIT